MHLSHRMQLVVAIILGFVLVGAVIGVLVREFEPSSQDATDNTVAQEETPGGSEDKTNEEQSDKTPEPEVSKPVAKTFDFTANPGDSYTALARNAVGQYAAENNISLSNEQIEKAAARLAYNAGSPLLYIGQSVTINKSDISALVGEKPATTDPTDNVATTPPSEDNQADNNFTFIAVAGDAYCLFARDAISSYAKDNNLDLTGAQRIAAETFIISDAGFPRLAIGQQVTFERETIKSAVDKALSLSPALLDNWQPYANLAGL